jgi:hypothetical protein
MDDIKIIRLQNGEDIISLCKQDEEEDGVTLVNPMTLMFKRLPTGKGIMMMGPWLPVELVEGNATWIYNQDILTIMTPSAKVVEYYNQSVIETDRGNFKTDDEIDETLDEIASMDGEDDDMMDEEDAMLELEQIRKEARKKLLH